MLHIKYGVNYRLFTDTLSQTEEIPFFSYFVASFYLEWVLHFCQIHFFYKYGRCNRLNIGISLWAELEGGLEAAAEESEEKSLKAYRWVQITKISLGFLHLYSCEYAT